MLPKDLQNIVDGFSFSFVHQQSFKTVLSSLKMAFEKEEIYMVFANGTILFESKNILRLPFQVLACNREKLKKSPPINLCSSGFKALQEIKREHLQEHWKYIKMDLPEILDILCPQGYTW